MLSSHVKMTANSSSSAIKHRWLWWGRNESEGDCARERWTRVWKGEDVRVFNGEAYRAAEFCQQGRKKRMKNKGKKMKKRWVEIWVCVSADSIEGEKRELVYIVSIILGFRSNDKITKILSCLVTKFLTYHLINFVMKLLYPQNCTMIL